MSTKIQINSLAALERLIGGDTEVEIEIRKSVALEMVNKHVTAKLLEKNEIFMALVQDRIDRAVLEFSTYLEKPLLEQIGNDPNGPMFRNTTMLAKEARRLYGELLRKKAEEAMPEILKQVEVMVVDVIKTKIAEKIKDIKL
jgi:uncharacterized protein (UPF0147 family)